MACALGLSAAGALAEDYNTAAARIADGQNRFFEEALKNAGKPSSNLSAAYETHIAGPGRAMTKVQIETSQSVIEGMGIKVVQGKEFDNVDVLGEAESSAGSARQTSSSTTPVAPATARAPAKASSEYDLGTALAPVEAAIPEPAIVLDGNGVPKELEFPGPKKK